jgi:hypothetical protein
MDTASSRSAGRSGAVRSGRGRSGPVRRYWTAPRTHGRLAIRQPAASVVRTTAADQFGSPRPGRDRTFLDEAVSPFLFAARAPPDPGPRLRACPTKGADRSGSGVERRVGRKVGPGYCRGSGRLPLAPTGTVVASDPVPMARLEALRRKVASKVATTKIVGPGDTPVTRQVPVTQ